MKSHPLLMQTLRLDVDVVEYVEEEREEQSIWHIKCWRKERAAILNCVSAVGRLGPNPLLITAGSSHAQTHAPVVLSHAADNNLNSCL